MLHYIKTVTGVKYTPMYRSEIDKRLWQVYAQPYQKYKEWDFSVLFLPFYRTKIAKERLWKLSKVTSPDKIDLYTDECLKNDEKLIVKEDGSLWRMPYIVVTLSDGTEEITYYESNEEAESAVAELVKKWNLKLYNFEKI